MAELDLDTEVVPLWCCTRTQKPLHHIAASSLPECSPRQARIRLSAYAWMHAIGFVCLYSYTPHPSCQYALQRPAESTLALRSDGKRQVRSANANFKLLKGPLLSSSLCTGFRWHARLLKLRDQRYYFICSPSQWAQRKVFSRSAYLEMGTLPVGLAYRVITPTDV